MKKVFLLTLILFGVNSASALTILDGLDAFLTGSPTTTDTPELPPGFFGVTLAGPSDPIPAVPDFPVESYPFPDVCGLPNPFPVDQLELDIEWVDPHGNVVGPDSQHAVGTKEKVIVPTPPYNFDTVVRRNNAIDLSNPGESEPVEIEMVWLSLRSVDPIPVSYGGGSDTTFYDVYVCLSDVVPPVKGRVMFEAVTATPGEVTGTSDIGPSTFDPDPLVGPQNPSQPADQQMQNGQLDFFENNPDQLGLPVAYKLVFLPVSGPGEAQIFDDPLGELTANQSPTLSVFHNPVPGTFTATPALTTVAVPLPLWAIIVLAMALGGLVLIRRRN